MRDALAACSPDPEPAAERLTFHGGWGAFAWHAEALSAVPAPLAREAALQRGAVLDRHLRALSDLSRAQVILDDAGVEWLTFKGPVLAETCFPRSDLRGYGDLDLLVHPAHLRRALRALAAAGWPVLDPLADLARRPMVGELHLRAPAGTPVDLHWHLLYQPREQRRLRIDPCRVVVRRQEVPLRRLRVPSIPLADHLVYVCVHSAIAGGHRLRWLADIAHMSAQRDLDWDTVVHTAHQWGAARPAALMLARARVLVAAPVPADVLSALDGSRTWRLAESAARLLSPIESDGGSLSAGVSRHSADHLPRAWLDLLLSPLRRVQHRGSRKQPLPPRVRVLDQPGGQELLDSFCDDVEAATALPSPVPGVSWS